MVEAHGVQSRTSEGYRERTVGIPACGQPMLEGKQNENGANIAGSYLQTLHPAGVVDKLNIPHHSRRCRELDVLSPDSHIPQMPKPF